MMISGSKNFLLTSIFQYVTYSQPSFFHSKMKVCFKFDSVKMHPSVSVNHFLGSFLSCLPAEEDGPGGAKHIDDLIWGDDEVED